MECSVLFFRFQETISPKHLIIYTPYVLDSEWHLIILVVGMGFAIIFILPNDIKDLIEVFFSVTESANKLIIKAQYLTAITISLVFFALFDVII